MDSKTRVKKTSITEGTGCRQSGRKRQKRERVLGWTSSYTPLVAKSLSCHKLVYNNDETFSRLQIGAQVSDLRLDCFQSVKMPPEGLSASLAPADETSNPGKGTLTVDKELGLTKLVPQESSAVVVHRFSKLYMKTQKILMLQAKPSCFITDNSGSTLEVCVSVQAIPYRNV
ncbi:hypothetical protein AVEN_187610-1 [Araneus ventricosus]|uniref:Uncharacterized protein n=1 Tax=Araneus ventricosus TaxID=182803 RepID=A0A4Y2S2L6_ARAVE|nr:hypothetical protein AVEN_187610-1 [Araneus ventricosus]